jgi:hypothetical protein
MDFKLPAIHKDTKPFCLGALVGAVLITWVGFDALGWKTSAASDALAKRQADGAVVTALARICSAQFNSAKNFPVRLAELQKTERYSRGQVVAKAGFATMHGEKEPTPGVSEACANLVIPEKP